MINPKHPRATSLTTREKIVKGVKLGITSLNGLISQGRGEAFDYLLGEKTNDFAKEAIKSATAILLLAKYPVLCVNGNTAALIPKEYIQLSNFLNCPIEINLFHKTRNREMAIKTYLKKIGKKNVILSSGSFSKIKGIASKRRFVSSKGIAKADVVLVPLEDGDRTEELIKLGKKVITIDVNPLSRTAQKATVTIVDNIIRTFPLLVKEVKNLKGFTREELERISKDYKNQEILKQAITYIRNV